MSNTPNKFEARLAKALPVLTAAVFGVFLLSLKFHFLDKFFATTWHGRFGFDYFSVPRAFKNLLHGMSIFATPDGSFGPYASWYPYHPSLAVWLGGPLSLFSPWASYAAFVILSAAVLFACAWLLGRFVPDAAPRRAGYFIMLCLPAVYLMLWCGQMHVFTVAAAALILADLLDLLFIKNPRWSARLGKYELRPALAAGILVSLFSKPMLLLILPALFAVRLYRASIIGSCGVYALVSAVFLFVRPLNPQGVGTDVLIDAAVNPAMLVKTVIVGGRESLTYRTEFLHDNAIHWLNLKSRSGFPDHGNMEFFSLSSFLAHAGLAVPQRVFMLPVYFIVFLSGLCYFVKNTEKRLACVLNVCALGILSFYTSYAVVYEYHYTTLAPVLAVMLGLYYSARGRALFGGAGLALFCAGGALLFAPTPYYWLINPAYGFHRPELAAFPLSQIHIFLTNHVYDWALEYMRVLRAVPVAVMLAGLLVMAYHTFREGFKKESL